MKKKDKSHPDKENLKWNKDCGYLPTCEGVYLVKGAWQEEDPREIDVYTAPKKGLSCFMEDFGSSGAGISDASDCHVSVQMSGLEFVKFVRTFKEGEAKNDYGEI